MESDRGASDDFRVVARNDHSAGQGPDRRDRALLRGGRFAEPGSSLREGPPHALSWRYYVSLPGVEYVGVYLWLIKDWSWSQLRWTGPALACGVLALLWLFAMLCSAVRHRLLSEAWLGLGLFLWLVANFVWMVGEFQELWWRSGDDGEEEEEAARDVAKWILTLSAALIVVFYAILVPLDVFASDRRSPLLRRLDSTSPPCPKPFRGCCREFRIWSGVHLLFWATKDCLWAWDLLVPYAVAFALTALLTLDLLWRLATHKHQYIDFVHVSLLFVWVVANGVWAVGELRSERDLSDEQFRDYAFVGRLPDLAFAERRAAGWIFFAGGCALAAFFAQWIAVSIRGTVPPYETFMLQSDDGGEGEDGTGGDVPDDGSELLVQSDGVLA